MSYLADYLNTPVPPDRTKEWAAWKEQLHALSTDCIPALLDTLRDGSEEQQYAALLALRFRFTFYAYGHGDGSERVWEIQAPGATEKTIIKPRITPSDNPFVIPEPSERRDRD